MSQFRWGILGTGNMATLFARDFAYAKSGVIAAVASREKSKADDFAQEFDIQHAIQDYYSLIHSDLVDVIYIAVPHVYHYDLIKECVLSGKAVLCEKPFCINQAQARDIYRLAERHKVFVMEAMWTRFTPVTEQVQEWIDSGDIGELTSIQATLSSFGSAQAEYRLNNKKLGGGALLDVGIYPIFLAQLLWGKPNFIQSQAVLNDDDIDMFNQILLGWDHGGLASLESSIVSLSPNRAILSGTAGYIEIEEDWHKSKTCRLVDVEGHEHKVAFDYQGMGYQFEINEVNRCLQKKLLQSPKHSWDNTLDVLATMDEIRADMGVFYEQEGMAEQERLYEHHHEHHHHKH